MIKRMSDGEAKARAEITDLRQRFVNLNGQVRVLAGRLDTLRDQLEHMAGLMTVILKSKPFDGSD